MLIVLLLVAVSIVLFLYIKAEAVAFALNNWIVYPSPFDQTRHTAVSIKGAAFLGLFMIVVMALFVLMIQNSQRPTVFLLQWSNALKP